MYVVYYESVGYGLYKEKKQFDDAMNAFHWANKQTASCVVDDTDRSFNIFHKNEFGVNVAEQEWYTCRCST